MHWLQQQLNKLQAPDTIIHLGAGLCRELDHWRATGAPRIVLVEPNPELLPELNRRIRASDPVDILPLAISAQSGREALRLFNFAMLSSLRNPTGLYQILPGLSQIGRAMIETVTIDQLLQDLNLSAEGDHWLVIDTPGEEAAILDQLEQNAKLHDFSRIFLSAGLEPLYQGAESARTLATRLEALGYNAAGRPDDSDGDWPRYHLVLDRMALECRELRNELQALKSRLKETEQARAEAEQQAQQQAQSRAEQSQTLAAELQNAKEAAKQQADQHSARIKELESALSEQGGKADQLAKERQQLQEQLAQAQEAHNTQNQALKAQLKETEQARAQAQEQTTKHLAQLEKVQADLSLALRLQMLRENDLKELQTRYGEVLTVKDEQQDLLTQLHHRLSRAAEYLQLVHAQSDEQRLPDELLEALTGKSDSAR